MIVEIKDFTETHSIVTVQLKGKQFGTTWAKLFDAEGTIISPTAAQVKEAFIEDRSSFEPYSIHRGY